MRLMNQHSRKKPYPVSNKTVRQVQSGEYVHLSKLLAESASPLFGPSVKPQDRDRLQFDFDAATGSIELAARRQSRVITSLTT